jgi:hypothetical protein
LFGEHRRVAADRRRRLGAAAPEPREQAAALCVRRAVGEDRNRQRADVRRGGDDAQRRGERRVVLRREQRGHEHEIRHAAADRIERALGRVRKNQLRADAVPHDGGDVRRLASIGFNGQNDRHRHR